MMCKIMLQCSLFNLLSFHFTVLRVHIMFDMQIANNFKTNTWFLCCFSRSVLNETFKVCSMSFLDIFLTLCFKTTDLVVFVPKYALTHTSTCTLSIYLFCIFQGCDSGNVYMLYGSIIHTIFQQVNWILVYLCVFLFKLVLKFMWSFTDVLLHDYIVFNLVLKILKMNAFSRHHIDEVISKTLKQPWCLQEMWVTLIQFEFHTIVSLCGNYLHDTQMIYIGIKCH